MILLHYRVVITLPGDYYIIGCNRPRSPNPSSTPKQVTLDVILNEICSIRDELVTVNERLDKVEDQLQSTQRDTDKYVDPDMLGASAKLKSNPSSRFKTSPNFEETPNFEEGADIYDYQMFGFRRYVPQQYQGPQTDDTRDHTQSLPTNRAERYTSPYRTQTSRIDNHQGPDEARHSVADTQSRYVNLDKFDGKVGEWDNWYHQFEFLATLRAQLSTVRQEEGESMDTGLRDRNAAQEAMKFRDPKSTQEAVVTVTHTQGASRIFW